ncbi:MAG: nucleotidyltransferase [Halothiobacillus sp. 24-54-40]|jgi:predicted nucleotidyltransferase|nr:nucleotidyltransferase family protein [Halothiobacillaceae bacterium]OYY39852.1 MAG: nucleotidyltransferase [Halothiobacillus sp. 35-54-62]OYZ87531.1 MAG: nucleotidyltransferase [Halothiobacillus sp. 24-54-40]OZA80966.1 MAG: nucleotidyltransferase [Halothiobacillus sp. 39-53-45]HQS03187.1 nucleotidyltransferase family protein [Halothiobacillus sp.]
MLLSQVRAKKASILALAERYGASDVRVFGSVARGDARPDSDLDLLVEFPKGYDLFAQRIPLTEQIQALLHCSVDLIPTHELNRHIRNHVLNEAVPL